MKNFILNIIGFLVFLLLFYIVLFYYVDKLYLRSYSESVNLNFNTYMLSDSQGAALGNSTEKINIFNFSADSDSYADMIRKIKYLIANCHVKTIIITVSDHTLSVYRQRKNNLDRSAIFTSRSDYSTYYEYLKERILKRYLVLLNTKSGVIMRNYILSNITNSLSFNKRNTNRETLWESLTSDEKREKSRRRAMFQFPDEEQSQELTATLKEIIQICRMNKIRLIGLKYPLSPDYLEAIEDKSYSADRIFIELGLKVLDLSKTFPRDDSFFKDPDHLNEKGAILFSEILCDSLKPIIDIE